MARQLQDIQNLLRFAKLDSIDYFAHSQTLYFANNLNETEYTIFEMDESLVDLLLDKEVLTVKGKDDENAVVCTSSATYDLREAETSNCLLFIPDGQLIDKKTVFDNTKGNENGSVTSCEVVTTTNTYFEIKKSLPRLNLVKQLLDEFPYLGHLEEEESQERGEWTKRYTMDDIVARVQASKLEITGKIRELRGIEINACICRLDIDYENQIVQSIMDLLDEMTWERSQVPVEECSEKLAQLYPPVIVNQVLQHYSTDATRGDPTISLNDSEISRHFGEHLLHHTTRFHLEEFQQLWQQLLPTDIHPSLSHLKGVALIDRASQPPSIWLFRRQDLDEDPESRFDELFAKKSRWTVDEISPFLVDLCPDGPIGITSLLSKYARSSTVKGQRIYSSRALKT